MHKRRHIITVFILLAFIGVLPLLAFAAPNAPAPELLVKYSDLFSWAVPGGLFALIAMVGYIAHAGNRNNQKQWLHIELNSKNIGLVALEVAELKGAHSVNHPGGRRYHDPEESPDPNRRTNDPAFRRR